jgi:hypothetical protein
MKVGTYLPDQNASIVSSMLFMPLQFEHCIEATTVRCMAWFSAAVSSGAPLVFVNIQTEQTLSSVYIYIYNSLVNCQWSGRLISHFSICLSKCFSFELKGKINSTGREICRCRQQNNTNVQRVQGIRLWFLPGVAEVSLELVPQQGEMRFGMDIKPTEEVISYCTFKFQDYF